MCSTHPPLPPFFIFLFPSIPTFTATINTYLPQLWRVELSQGLYRSLNKSYLLATEQAYKHIDAFLASHPSLPLALPRFHASTIKVLVGVFELLLAFLWLTRRWRTAAWGSALCFASWMAIAWSEFLPDSAGGEEGMSFALFFLGLSLGLLYIGPRSGKKVGGDAAGEGAGGAGAKRRR